MANTFWSADVAVANASLLSQRVSLSLIAAAAFILSQAPSVATAACGDVFEICGNAVDDDCDGSNDEGCSMCGPSTVGVFDYKMTSLNEIKTATNNSLTYARFLASTWQFLPSHRMKTLQFMLEGIDLESCCDFFTVGGIANTGTSGIFLTPSVNMTSSTTPMSFTTDVSNQKTGIIATSVHAMCTNGGGSTFRTVPLNTGVDGIMLHKDDDSYFLINLPANREAIINVDHTFGEPGTRDFDIFVTTGSAFGTSCANSTVCGFSGSSTGEVVRVAPTGSARTLRVHLNAYAGAGRYRLFVASPVTTFGFDVDIGYETNDGPGSANDTRAKGTWGQAQRWMMAATDGQYRMKSSAFVTRNITCSSCYDVVYNNDNEISGCTPGRTTLGLWGYYVELPMPFWQGTSWTSSTGLCADSFSSMSRVGEVITHEWGHYEWELCDERSGLGTFNTFPWCPNTESSPVGLNKCGFSLMAGTGLANFTTGNRHFEFCSGGDHALDVTSGVAAMPPPDNYTDITSDSPAIVEPPGTGDFSQLKRAGERLEQLDSTLLTFTGPT